jgi:hypothetical protein
VKAGGSGGGIGCPVDLSPDDNPIDNPGKGLKSPPLRSDSRGIDLLLSDYLPEKHHPPGARRRSNDAIGTAFPGQASDLLGRSTVEEFFGAGMAHFGNNVALSPVLMGSIDAGRDRVAPAETMADNGGKPG